MTRQEKKKTPVWSAYSSELLGETYYEAIHPSGLRVQICPKDFSTLSAALGVWYGSNDTAVGDEHKEGIAHFLEHKMFEAPDGGDAEDEFSALGAEVNAFTNDDRTVYLVSCTDHGREAVEALLRLVRTLHVTAASMERECGIIGEEISMDDDSRWDACYGEMLRGMYFNHPVKQSICGSIASIGELTPDDLRTVFRRFYRPDNMVLCVSGDLSRDEVMAAVDAVFPHRKTRPAADKAPFDEPPAVKEKRMHLHRPTARPVFYIGIKDPCVPEDKWELLLRDLRMNVLCEMLFSEAAPLSEELFDTHLITTGLDHSSDIGRGYHFSYCAEESDDPEAVFSTFRAHVEKLHREGLSREQFDRSRRILYSDYVSTFDSTESISELMLNYALEGLQLFDFLEAFRLVTFGSVCGLFDEVFREEQFVLSTVEPLPEEPASGNK